MALTYYIYRTSLGRVAIQTDGQAVTRLAYGPARLEGRLRANRLTNRASTEVLEYLAGKRVSFDVPVKVDGTDFQRAVWEAICRIPYGEVRTYAQIADAIGHPGAQRAVGAAAGANRVPILIPCHRVVGARGNLCGYSAGPLVEDGLKIKRFLLDLESRYRSAAICADAQH